MNITKEQAEIILNALVIADHEAQVGAEDAIAITKEIKKKFPDINVENYMRDFEYSLSWEKVCKEK